MYRVVIAVIALLLFVVVVFSFGCAGKKEISYIQQRLNVDITDHPGLQASVNSFLTSPHQVADTMWQNNESRIRAIITYKFVNPLAKSVSVTLYYAPGHTKTLFATNNFQWADSTFYVGSHIMWNGSLWFEPRNIRLIEARAADIPTDYITKPDTTFVDD